MLDRTVFAKGMSILGISLNAEESLTETKLEVYYSILNIMSNEAFENAVYAVARDRVYKGLPTPAEILKYDTTRDDLLAGTREQAKAMYNKFYEESRAMLEYCTQNRERIPKDRDFFRSVDYAKLKRKDESSTYTKQELYVLNELGGADWLIDIRHYANSNDVIEQIENIIKKAKVTKYLSAGSDNKIESKKVKALLGRVA